MWASCPVHTPVCSMGLMRAPHSRQSQPFCLRTTPLVPPQGERIKSCCRHPHVAATDRMCQSHGLLLPNIHKVMDTCTGTPPGPFSPTSIQILPRHRSRYIVPGVTALALCGKLCQGLLPESLYNGLDLSRAVRCRSMSTIYFRNQ